VLDLNAHRDQFWLQSYITESCNASASQAMAVISETVDHMYTSDGTERARSDDRVHDASAPKHQALQPFATSGPIATRPLNSHCSHAVSQAR
jgi:hypothetical protein